MNSNEITLISENTSKKVTTTLEEIYKPLDEYVKYYNLPTENILASSNEKAKVLSGFSSVIDGLPIEQRQNSQYLTKFIIASSVGLFDGALNYLWDEIIKALRNVVISYDLEYFYSVACQVNNNYKNLSNQEDLSYISDFDLIGVLKRIGIIDSIAFKNLEQINFFRNQASAAHPNSNELSGIKLLSMFEDGIRYAITLQPDRTVVEVRQLFDNVRNQDIPTEDFNLIAEGLLNLPQTRRDDFLSSIFGVFCDLSKDGFVLKNILEISKRIWDYVSEDTKYLIGSKFGQYRKNGFVEQKKRVNIFLENVGGLNYKDEDSIVAELIDKLGKLKSVHFSFNNFYNEYNYMSDIDQLLPDKRIPNVIKPLFIKTICLCYAGNGLGYRDGVDENAEKLYIKFIENFGIDEIKIFLTLFMDDDFIVDLYKMKPVNRLKKLCEYFRTKITSAKVLSCLDFIIAFSASLDKLKTDSGYKKMLDRLN